MSCGPIAMRPLCSSMLGGCSSVTGTTRDSSSYQVSVPALASNATSVPSGETASRGHKGAPGEPVQANAGFNACAVSSGDHGHCSGPQSIGGSSGRTISSVGEVSPVVVDGTGEGGAAGTSLSSPSDTTSTPTTSTPTAAATARIGHRHPLLGSD